MLGRGIYPVLLLATILCCLLVIGQGLDLRQSYGIYISSLLLVLITLEFLVPARRQWRMSASSFFYRDLPYMLIGGITVGLANYVVALTAMSVSIPELALPLLLQVLAGLLLVDLLWYAYHRYCHEATGGIGRFFWRVHVLHHLPRQVYVLMHGVSHPLNTLISRLIMNAPLVLLGFSVEAIFVCNVLITLQTLVSHFNVDIRAGVLNYLFVGTELHRYHHSADINEAKNYCAVLTVWDHVFGTFYYRDGRLPAVLGVSNTALPDEREIIRAIQLPFIRND